VYFREPGLRPGFSGHIYAKAGDPVEWAAGRQAAVITKVRKK
jgi:hypothetical protein